MKSKNYDWQGLEGDVARFYTYLGSTPTTSPKPRGKSPGWKTGDKRKKKKTYPIAKKSYSRPKESKKKTA